MDGEWFSEIYYQFELFENVLSIMYVMDVNIGIGFIVEYFSGKSQ
jgi:hypothetical protein